MVLWARQYGWLESYPEKSTQPNRTIFVSSSEPPLEKDTLYSFVVDLQSIGPMRSDSMGMKPLDYTEILAWSQLMKRDLSPLQVETLRMMSMAYVAERSKCEGKPPRPSPWVARNNASEVERQLEEVLDGLAKRSNGTKQ